MGIFQTSVTCCCPVKQKHTVINEEALINSISNNNSISKKNKENQTVRDIEIKVGKSMIKKTTNPEETYTQIKELGEGAFGKVIKVEHKFTKEYRAIKIIDKTNLIDGIEDNEIENEITILKSLDHPNIIKVYEFYDYNGSIFIVSELVGDGDLYKLIEELKVLNEQLSLKILYQLLSAVTYLHSENVFHGDIKPENIMIDNFKKCKISNKSTKTDLFGFDIKLIDFGTSKMFNKPKVFHNLVGTAFYVAPEVILGGYHKQCDIWSAGVVFYVMLTGRFPFDGESDEEIFNKIKYEKPIMNSKEIKLLSPEIRDLLTKMLEKDPIERITAKEAMIHKAFESLIKNKEELNATTLNRGNSQNILKKLKTNKTGKFNQAITAFITHNYLSKEIAQKHKEIFNAIDQDGDGRLTKDELIEGYKKVGCDYKPEEIEEILSHIDRDNNGYIEIEEFISASVDINVLLSETNIKLAFETIDSDNSGLVSLDEVGKFIGGENYDEVLIEKVIKEAGKDPKAEITFEDFKDIINVLKKEEKED